MGCCSGARKPRQVQEIHKWEYINLEDFKNGNCLTFFSYLWVWVLALTSCVVYALDTFVLVNLLAKNKWSSSIDPYIDIKITKWIFVGCILFSWTLCIYEWIRAIRVMKQQSVTEDYLDPLAVILQSIRPRGFRRFLVFAELTKSTKKASWVAIFVYYQRKESLRLLAAEGPRNVINAFTVYSVAKADVLKIGAARVDSMILQFFKNIGALFETKRQEALVLISMTFVLLIWCFFMILLILAFFFWLFFISHYIRDETLTGYCRRKVEARLARIVKAKTDGAWAKEQRRQEKLEAKGDFEAMAALSIQKREPTLPQFGGDADKSTTETIPTVAHFESVSTLPRYQSQPHTPADEYGDAPFGRQYSGQSGLLDNGAPMGYSTPMGPSRPSTSHSYASSRGPQVPPLSIPQDNAYLPPIRGTTPLSASTNYEPGRRYSPPNQYNNTPWRTPTSQVQESPQEYEMQSAPAIPAALRAAGGPRNPNAGQNRGPGSMPYGPPGRSFTAPPNQPYGFDGSPPRIGTAPPSMPTGPMYPSGGRSMTPSGPPPPRSMTPADPVRVGTPTGRVSPPDFSQQRTMTPTGRMTPQSTRGPPFNRPPDQGDYNRRPPPGGPPGMAM